MRVLWLATAPSLFDESKVMGWIASLEAIVRNYCTNIELGITFEYADERFKVQRENVTYYPIKICRSFCDVVRMKFNGNDNWYLKQEPLLRVIEDFKPDIIQCFGSEWNWGLISKVTNVPIVVHMQGFYNIYDYENQVVLQKGSLLYNLSHPRSFLQCIFLKKYDAHRCEVEKEIMRNCHYFMGRTEWDKNIVKYYSPNSHYFHCPEAIRPAIYDSDTKWQYEQSNKLKIVTIASAGSLKGNGIILQTARFLKDLGIDFEWRVSGNKDHFAAFERRLKIRHDDVNVKLLGFISANEIVDELLNAEIFVLPSIIDNSPNSLCEAQLIGCPVVATCVGGIPQMVENGKTGILYPYNEPHTLAFTLLNLHNNPSKLNELSRDQQVMAHERHNPEKLAKRLIEIYNQVLAN